MVWTQMCMTTEFLSHTLVLYIFYFFHESVFLCFQQPAEPPEQVWLTTWTASLIIIFNGNCSARSQLEHHHVLLSAHGSVENWVSWSTTAFSNHRCCMLEVLFACCWMVCLLLCQPVSRSHLMCRWTWSRFETQINKNTTLKCFEHIFEKLQKCTICPNKQNVLFFNWPDSETLECIICGWCTTGDGKNIFIFFGQFENWGVEILAI